MSNEPGGGPAFPTVARKVDAPNYGNASQNLTIDVPAQDGMTLRDYFAAKALMGMLSNQGESVRSNDDIRSIAGFSYDIADAMLEERARRS